MSEGKRLTREEWEDIKKGFGVATAIQGKGTRKRIYMATIKPYEDYAFSRELSLVTAIAKVAPKMRGLHFLAEAVDKVFEEGFYDE